MPVRPDGDYLRKLALRRKVSGDIPAICSVEAEVCRTLARIEHDNLSLEFVAHKVERRDEIRIAGNDDKCVGGVCVGIAEKRGGEIDVCSLLFDLYHMDKAVCGCGTVLTSGIDGWNPCLVLVVVAFDYVYVAMRNNGLKIDVLAFNRCRIVRICLGSGYEVLDGCEFVVCVKFRTCEHGMDKRGDVKPFAGCASAQQPMVEIAAIDVCYRFHLHSVKKIGPQTLRSKTLYRVGRALRLDMNLLRGSARIVPNRAARNKWANLKM